MLKRRVTESHRFGIPLSVMYLEDRRVRHHQPKVRQPDRAANGRHGRARASKVLREMDVLAKLENGEFVVMLPGSTQTEAGRVAKRCASQLPIASCRSSIASCKFAFATASPSSSRTKPPKNCSPAHGRASADAELRGQPNA